MTIFVGSKKFFSVKSNFIWSLNTSSMIWKSTWKRRDPLCLPHKLKVSSIRFCNHWFSCTQTEFSTET